MKNFGKNLADLVKVKTIVTLVVILVFTVLALRGTIDADSVMYVVTTVIAFYFGTQHEQKFSENTDHSASCPFMTDDSTESEIETDGGEFDV